MQMLDLTKCPRGRLHAIFMRRMCADEGKQLANVLQAAVDAGTPGGWPDPSAWEHSMQIPGMSEG